MSGVTAGKRCPDGPASPSNGGQCPADAQSTEVTRWLSGVAGSLASLTSGGPWEDLQPLKESLRDVTVVALGEATHGSHEFFSMKHRLVEFLVQEMGFNVFAMEAGYSGGLAVNRYVHGESGDVDQVLGHLGFSVWDTGEVWDLISWLRVHNQDLPTESQVMFAGFDIQLIDDGVVLLWTYLDRVAPEYLLTVEALLRSVGSNPSVREEGLAEKKAETVAKLFGIVHFLSSDPTRFIAVTSEAEYKQALGVARNVARYYDTYGHPRDRAGTGPKRDLYMADTVDEMIRDAGPGTRIILWAHNYHISAIPEAMGSHLRARWGNQYYALGFLFNEGSFQALSDSEAGQMGGKMVEFTVAGAPAGYSEWYLACAGLGDSLIDLRQKPDSAEVRAWLEQARPMRITGASYNPAKAEEYATSVALTAFDGIVYVPLTSRAHPSP